MQLNHFFLQQLLSVLDPLYALSGPYRVAIKQYNGHRHACAMGPHNKPVDPFAVKN